MARSHPMSRVVACASNPACVRIDHLSLEGALCGKPADPSEGAPRERAQCGSFGPGNGNSG